MIYLYGAGGHAKVIIDILIAMHQKPAGIFDDFSNQDLLNGVPVMRYEPQHIGNNDKVLISIGDNTTRKEISRKMQYSFATAIHPKTCTSHFSSTGEGSVIMQGVVLQSGAEIKKHCILNTSCSIDHDCVVNDFVHIAPGATLCGNVTIGEGTHVGAAAVIIPGVTIGKWCIIGAGSVVISNVPDNCAVAGNPARLLHQQILGT